MQSEISQKSNTLQLADEDAAELSSPATTVSVRTDPHAPAPFSSLTGRMDRMDQRIEKMYELMISMSQESKVNSAMTQVCGIRQFARSPDCLISNCWYQLRRKLKLTSFG